MYNGFYIDKPVGNNEFSYEQRNHKSLYVPKLIDSTIEDIQLGDEIVFEDYDFDGQLSAHTGLKNFYRLSWKGKDIYLFDNHNHAYYFWYLARNLRVIADNNTLIHIDEHADTRDPNVDLLKPESYDMGKVFHFTNYVLNVGNYIIPAQREGMIGDIVQIRNDTNLESYLQGDFHTNKDTILNLDLDFFQPDLDFINYEKKKKVVLDAASRAKVITVATSPFFIDQSRAIEVFKDIFGEQTLGLSYHFE